MFACNQGIPAAVKDRGLQGLPLLERKEFTADARQYSVLMPGAFEYTLLAKCQVFLGLLDAAALSRLLLPRVFETRWPAAGRRLIRNLAHNTAVLRKLTSSGILCAGDAPL